MRSSIENGISVLRTSGCGPTACAHQVVAIERDVERADGHVVAGDLAEVAGQALGDRHAAGADADEREVGQAAIAFEDFVRDARERAGHALGIHDNWHWFTSLRTRGSAFKEFTGNHITLAIHR